MIKTKMCELLGVKHPIIQAGMGPFSNNKLSIAAANAGTLGLMSTSGLHEATRKDQYKIYEHWAQTAGADPKSDKKADAEKSGENTESKPEADLSQIESKGQFRAKGKPGKIIVMASADMFKDNVLDDEGKGANAIFVMNAIDYLNNREDIAIMRSKEQRFNPLDDTAAGTKTFVKTFNIAGLPILVILFGLGIWLRRVSRKKHIQTMFQK